MGLITTTHGDMDESLLNKREGEIDNEDEHTTWVEYWLDRTDECTIEGHDITQSSPDFPGVFFERVHRSAHVTLKKLPEGMETILGAFGG